MILAILKSLLIGFVILGVGMFFLSIINFFIQKNRAKHYYEQGYASSIDSGFEIKRKDEKLKVSSDETYFILF